MRRTIRRTRRVGHLLVLAARLARLAPDPASAAKAAWVTLVFGAQRLVRRPGLRARTLRLRIGTKSRSLEVSDYGELMVVRDVLLDEEYRLPDDADPRVILDVGANIGISVLYFRARHPDARIVALEPDPESFERLARNVGADPHVDLLNTAAGERPGEIALFRPPGFSIAASTRPIAGEDATPVRVAARTLDDVCDELRLDRVDVLKLDVEGAELDVLAGFSRVDEVGFVIGEAHPDLIDGRVAELFARLRAFELRILSATPDSLVFTAVSRRLLPAASAVIPFVAAG